MTGRRVSVVASEVLGVPGTGGPGTADSLLAVALGRRGHRVELLVAPGRELGVLSSEWQQIYGAAGVVVRPLENTRRVRPPFLAPTTAVLEGLRADPPDVVVADDWRGLAYAALRSRQLRTAFAETAFVVYCHGPARVLAEAARKVPDTLARFGEEVAERACIELADAVVSPSAWLLRWMRDHRWPVPEDALVVQNLWQSVALGERPSRAASGQRVRRLAFFGQLREGKGIVVFVQALRELEPEALRDVEVLFLGRETPRWTAERVREELGQVAERAASVRFESGLERGAALEELLRPGTLVVLPSLLENSPYAVAECIEHGIPFLAARTGGVPELVAEEDRERVLFEPNAHDLANRLQQALSHMDGLGPAAPARMPAAALESWLDLVARVLPATARTERSAAKRVAVVARGAESALRANRLAERTRTVEVEVVVAESRKAGLERAAAEWVVFLDEEDLPDDGMVDTLVAAQAASNADVVTAAVRTGDDLDGVHLFLGDPGALGLVENHYGVAGLVRREAAARQPLVDGAVDPDWPLLAGLVLAGSRAVSIPDPLSAHRGRPGRIDDVPGEGLAVLEAFEDGGAGHLSDLPQLTATLAAAFARLGTQQPQLAGRRSVVARGLRVLRTEGVAGVARRTRWLRSR